MAQEGEDIRSEIHDQRQLGYAVLKQVLKTEEVQELLDHYSRLRELDPAKKSRRLRLSRGAGLVSSEPASAGS